MVKAENVADIPVDKLASHVHPEGGDSQRSFFTGLVGDKCGVLLENWHAEALTSVVVPTSMQDSG